MLEGLIRIQPKVHRDLRGFFLESYSGARYREMGVRVAFVQDNHSFSKQSVLRGMHFQRGQAKLIYCPKGRIFDVAVDIRKDSPTYGKWQGFYLDGEMHEQLFMPDGFAHGFCVLSEEAHVIYKVSTLFNKDLERGFFWNDAEVGIQWPIEKPLVSERDALALSMREVV